MSKIKKGDKVKVRKNEKTGIVETVYDLGYWHMSEDQYSILLDDGAGLVTLSDSDIEKIEEIGPKCRCGLKYARSGGKHSDWCELYEREE